MRTRDIRRRISALTKELSSLKKELRARQKACEHDWTVEYGGEYEESEEIPDRNGGTFRVGGVAMPKWNRTCSRCGVSQETWQYDIPKHAMKNGTRPDPSKIHFWWTGDEKKGKAPGTPHWF